MPHRHNQDYGLGGPAVNVLPVADFDDEDHKLLVVD